MNKNGKKKKKKGFYFASEVHKENAGKAGIALFGNFTGFCCTYRKNYADRRGGRRKLYENSA